MLEMLSMYIWRRCREYIQLGFCLMVEKLTVLGETNCWEKIRSICRPPWPRPWSFTGRLSLLWSLLPVGGKSTLVGVKFCRYVKLRLR